MLTLARGRRDHPSGTPARQTVYGSLAGSRSVADPTGANVTEVMLNGAKYRIKDQNVYMPPFGPAYSDAELAAVANYVIAHFRGKTGRVTPEDVAKRGENSARGTRGHAAAPIRPMSKKLVVFRIAKRRHGRSRDAAQPNDHGR